MKAIIQFIIAIAITGTAMAQDDGRDPNWFRRFLRNERQGRSFALPPQPQGEWFPGGTYYQLPDGTLRAVDDGWVAPPNWIPVGSYLPSRKIQCYQPKRYRWSYVQDMGRPGWPGQWVLVPEY